ncbi:MAG: hypothetical protein H5T86_06985, partial [Armatimonadetes bacterium]|nr:hypothetical protein [Armatimonadota bacterium]
MALAFNMWDWPDQWEPDEVDSQALAFLRGHLRPAGYFYGSLPAWTQTAAMAAATVLGGDMRGDRPFAAVVTARSLSAVLLGLVAGLGTLYVAALWGTLAGCAFATTIALNPLLVNISHFATVDPYLVALYAAVALLFLRHTAQSEDNGATFWPMPLLSGIAAAIKVYGIAAAVLPVTAVLRAPSRHRLPLAGWAVLLFAAGYLMGHPTVPLEPVRWARDVISIASVKQHGASSPLSLLGCAKYLTSLAWACGPAATALALLGMFVSIRKREPWATGICAMLAASILLFTGSFWWAHRFAAPSIAVVALLAAYGTRRLAQWRKWGALSALVILAAWGAMETSVVLAHFAFDARRTARQWLASQVRPAEIVWVSPGELSPPPPAIKLFVRPPAGGARNPDELPLLKAAVRLKSFVSGEPFTEAWQRQLWPYRVHL